MMGGQRVGLKEVDDAIWLVHIMYRDPSCVDEEHRTLPTIDNPFDVKLLPTSPVRSAAYVSGSDPVEAGAGGRT